MRMAGTALSALLLAATSAQADSVATSALGRASASVVNPVTLRPIRDLDFGIITVGPQASGSVIVSPGAAGAHYAGSVRQVCGSGCVMPHPARFEVTGEAGRSYVITTPNSILAPNESLSPLRIDAIRLKTASRPDSVAAGQINFSGLDHFDLGGTLHVPAGAAADSYWLNLPVIMTYD
jgi:hypothetical protein